MRCVVTRIRLALGVAAVICAAVHAQSVRDVQNAELIRDLSFPRLGYQFFRIQVPPGCTQLVVGLHGGSGDADLFVRHGALPNGTQFHGRSTRPGNTEWVVVKRPAAGDWYFLVFAKTAVARTMAWAIYDGPAHAAVAAPVISPVGGTYTGAVNVTMSCATPGAQIRVTTDGTAPGPASPLYAPFVITQSATVKARAYSGSQSSTVATAVYQIVAPPTAPPPAGPAVVELANAQVLAHQANPKGGGTYYRLTIPDGQTHLVFGMTYGVGDADMYVRRGALPTGTQYDYRPYKPGNTESVQILFPQPGDWYLLVFGRAAYAGLSVWGIYWKDARLTTVATPVIQPAGGTFHAPVQVNMSCSTPGATVRYTLDGTDPTATSTPYAPFTLHANAMVKARGFKDGWTESLVATAAFNVETNLPAQPGLPPMNRMVDIERFTWTPLNSDGTRARMTAPLRWGYRYIGLSGNYSTDFLGKLYPTANGVYEIVIPHRTKLIVQFHSPVRPDPNLPTHGIVLEYSFDPRVPVNMFGARVLHYSYRGVYPQLKDWSWITRSSPAPGWNAFELIKR